MNSVWGMPGKGEFHAQVQELKAYPDQFLGYFHMLLNKYFELINRISNNHHVVKQNTNFCKCIGIEEIVAVFLRYVFTIYSNKKACMEMIRKSFSIFNARKKHSQMLCHCIVCKHLHVDLNTES